MEVNANAVIERLLDQIRQQALTIAILQTQVAELEKPDAEQ